MKETKSVCIQFEYKKYNKEIEIGYNEENRFHSIIKTHEEFGRKGIIIDSQGHIINSFPFSNYKEIEDCNAAEYLDGFLIAHMHEGLYKALIQIKKERV
jgi:hypothetical protein